MSISFQMWYEQNKVWIQDCERNIKGWKVLKLEEQAYYTSQAMVAFGKQTGHKEYVVDKAWNPVQKEEFARLILQEAQREKEVQYYIWEGV